MITINTDVDVYIEDFDDDDIFDEAYSRLKEFLAMNKIRARDQAWVDKFARLFSDMPLDEYAPSTAYYIKSEEDLKNWIAKQ